MDRHGRRVAVLEHAVDVGRVEVEHLAGAMAQLERRAAEHEALLDDLALHHRDRAARDVVIVEARVVAGRPRDHPHVHVVVAPELLEVAIAGGAVAHQRPPPRRVGGDAGDQLAQLAAVAIAMQLRRWRRARSWGGGLRAEEARGIALAQRDLHGVSQRQLAGGDHGPVAAVDQAVDADLAERPRRPLARRRRRCRGRRRGRWRPDRRARRAARGAAARGRRASRSTRAAGGARAGPRRRRRATRSASPRRSRSAPATSSAGRARRPTPGRGGRAAARRGARASRAPRPGARSRSGRRAPRPRRRPRRTPRRAEPRQRGQVRVGQADRGPGAEPGGQLGDALVVGGEQRLGLGGGERLDPERGGGGHQRAVDAVGRQRAPRACRDRDRRGRAESRARRGPERPAVAMADEARRLAAPRQLPEQRLGPEMLVDVDSCERQRPIV